MKVLQVIDTLCVGGAEKVVVTLSNLLYENGIKVSLLLFFKKENLLSELHPDIPVYFLERENKFSIKKMQEFSEILKQYDIIHSHLKHNYRYTKLTALFFAVQTPLIFHDHSHNLRNDNLSSKAFKDSLFKNILKPKYYIGVSQENCTWAFDKLNVEKNNIFLLENFIQKVNNDNQIKREGIVVVSNISRIKNLSFALKFIKKLNENLTIYGKIYDEIYFNELQTEIAQLGIVDKVKFINDESNIQSILYKYKYAIHTSLKETGPLVLIEYLAQSLPFLSLASGQVFETVKNDLPDFFIDKFDLKIWLKKSNKIKSKDPNYILDIYNKYYNSGYYFSKCQKIYKKIITY